MIFNFFLFYRFNVKDIFDEYLLNVYWCLVFIYYVIICVSIVIKNSLNLIIK